MKNWDKIAADLIREEEEKDGQPIEPHRNATYADVRESAFSLMKTLAPYLPQEGMDESHRKLQASLIESGKELQMLKEEWEKEDLRKVVEKTEAEMEEMGKEKGWSDPEREAQAQEEEEERHDPNSCASNPTQHGSDDGVLV